jgi:hypothetical protein
MALATFFAATEQELHSGGESLDDAVRIADSDGYLAALGVYHELHCLVSHTSHNGLSAHRYLPTII